MSLLVTMPHDPFPMEMAFASTLPKHPSSVFLPLSRCRAQLLLLLLPANVPKGSLLGHQMPPLLAHRRAKPWSLLPIATLNQWLLGNLGT